MTHPTAAADDTKMPIEPAEALIAWFDANAKTDGKRTRFRIPVTVRFADEYRLELGESYIGGPTAPAQAIRLHLDDGGLSVALLDTVRDRCGTDTLECSMWLEGFWGMLNPGLDDDEIEPGTLPFAVLSVGPVLTDKDELVVSR